MGIYNANAWRASVGTGENAAYVTMASGREAVAEAMKRSKGRAVSLIEGQTDGHFFSVSYSREAMPRNYKFSRADARRFASGEFTPDGYSDF